MHKLTYLIKLYLYSLRGKANKIITLRANYLKSRGAKIGDNTRIFSEIGGAEPFLIEIKDDCVIATGVQMITHDNAIGMYMGDKATDIFGKIIIGQHSFIGSNSLILPGVELGRNTIVGAGSVVTKSFKEGNVVIAGNPAKVVTTTERYVDKNKDIAIDIAGLNFEGKLNKILNLESDKLMKK